MSNTLPRATTFVVSIFLACLFPPFWGQRATAAEPDSQPEPSWAFRTPQRPPIPNVADDWLQNPVDAFVLRKLKQSGIRPSPPADRRTLARRVTLDLTGLPPSPEQLSAFLQDDRPDAYARLVDRLLASPAYGERWGQHWLDVVRYADSDGFEYDDPRPHAWRYRDWVIDALNGDKSWDRFVQEQLAADELFSGDRRALAALGLHRLGPLRKNAGMQDVAKNRQEVLTEVVDAVGAAFFGLTFGCARCHDHMFDPISQADYYGLQAFFAATEATDVALVSNDERQAREAAIAKWHKRTEQLDRRIRQIELPARERLLAARRKQLPANVRDVLDTPPEKRTADQLKAIERADVVLAITEQDILTAVAGPARDTLRRLWQERVKLASAEPAPVPAIMAIKDRAGPPPVTHLLNRGDPHQPLDVVPPTFPGAMRSGQPAVVNGGGTKQIDINENGAGVHDRASATGRRAVLARWLSGPDHPLAARVFANRLWQHHFGRGIVATPNDFGAMGSEPSHPELLDWLAVELVCGGSVKRIHRLILLSATYQQSSSNENPQARVADPDNRLLWRANRRRLEAETLRDALLTVAGSLNRSAGGPGVRLPLPPEIAALQYKGTWQADADVARHRRRTVYLFVKRNNRPPLLESFDAPGTMVSCGRRTESSHAGQSLALMNSPLLARQSALFAQRLLREAGRDRRAIVTRAYQLALARQPRAEELELGTAFLAGPQHALSERLADLCLVVFNLDEFIYVD